MKKTSKKQIIRKIMDTASNKLNKPTISILIQSRTLAQTQSFFSLYQKSRWKFLKLNFQMEELWIITLMLWLLSSFFIWLKPLFRESEHDPIR